VNVPNKPYHQPPADSSGSDDYLSKLADSILKKETRPVTAIPPGGLSRQMMPPIHTPPPTSAPPRVSPLPPPVYHPTGSMPTPPRSNTDTRTGLARDTSDWVRRVDFYDASGNFLPGTILVFEDGLVGVFKEKNARKEYEIIYQLAPTGKAIPQGLPLNSYTVEPIGRLTTQLLETLCNTGRWERDLIIFHLLKYKDRVHIPAITDISPDSEPISQSEHLSQVSIQRLPAEMFRSDFKGDEPEKPALVRGREMTIEFGPSQRWKAVYWGKDEMGHVVAHNTHDEWTLMHLDLNRFRDSVVFGNVVGNETIRQMERDFSRA
jgi:hypothetical protein